MWPLDFIGDLVNQQRLTERDKDCIRQLVALEVTFNFGRLVLFFSALVGHRHKFTQVAPYLATIVGDAPVWEHVRWDSAPILLARSMNKHDLLRIGTWYTNLDRLSQSYRQLARQSELLQADSGKGAAAGITADTMAAEWQQLLQDTARLVDVRRPFVHEAVESARHATHADEPVSTAVPVVDSKEPTIYQYDGTKWVPITAAQIVEEYAHVPLELKRT